MNMLPEVVDSSGVCAHTDASVFGAEIPIGGIAGDQQAALFGQGCFNEGEAKNTYGTGCFLLLNAGNERPHSANGLISTVAWRIGGATTYALEGSVFVGGAVIQWLRDELGLLRSAGESYEYAVSIDNSAGAYIVPAFSGLGAPYWEAEARGMICGLTRAARKEHIVRAALEAIAYQTRDLLEAVQTDAGTSLKELMVDGGACENDFLMQFQADIIGKNVNRPANIESTALGAAYLAGLSVGIFPSFDAIRTVRKVDRLFIPMIGEAERKQKTDGWKRAVAMCRNHSEG
jgi:glycerol kinase